MTGQFPTTNYSNSSKGTKTPTLPFQRPRTAGSSGRERVFRQLRPQTATPPPQTSHTPPSPAPTPNPNPSSKVRLGTGSITSGKFGRSNVPSSPAASNRLRPKSAGGQNPHTHPSIQQAQFQTAQTSKLGLGSVVYRKRSLQNDFGVSGQGVQPPQTQSLRSSSFNQTSSSSSNSNNRNFLNQSPQSLLKSYQQNKKSNFNDRDQQSFYNINSTSNMNSNSSIQPPDSQILSTTPPPSPPPTKPNPNPHPNPNPNPSSTAPPGTFYDIFSFGR